MENIICEHCYREPGTVCVPVLITHELTGDETSMNAKVCACCAASMTFYVNVFVVTREYGGPEEGGWWFNRGRPIASVPVVGFDNTDAVRDSLMKQLNHHQQGSIDSVVGGCHIESMIEPWFALPWPAVRPQYE